MPDSSQLDRKSGSAARVARWPLLIVAAWSVKASFGVWVGEHCESAAAWHYLCADVGLWSGFIEATHAGGIPYVDFPREYPVGIGALFWLCGQLFGIHGVLATVRLQVVLALLGDLLCALLLYLALRPQGDRRASLWAVALLCMPSMVVLSPLRFDSMVGVVTLLGYLAHQRGRFLWAAGLWSFGVTLKWYPAIALAIAELAAVDRAYWRARLPRVLGVVVGVQLAINGPFLIAGWLLHGSVQHWLDTYLFHVERRLAPDTVLGVIALWIGPVSVERHAAWLSLGLAGLVLLTRRRMPLSTKFVLVCGALLLCNRVYSPQFHLWFLPFALLVAAQHTGAQRMLLVGLLGLVDVANIAIFPFLYAGVVAEVQGHFGWGAMAAIGALYSEFFTSAVFLRAFALLALLATLYQLDGDRAARESPAA